MVRREGIALEGDGLVELMVLQVGDKELVIDDIAWIGNEWNRSVWNEK